MILQKMLNHAMEIADWMKKPAYIFEKISSGFAVVDEETSEKLKCDSAYKFKGVVYPKP